VEEGRVGSRGSGAVATPTAPATSGGEVVRYAPDGLAVIDADARFVQANPAAVLLCGLDPDAVAGAP
jgi:PAS domain-containing protein